MTGSSFCLTSPPDGGISSLTFSSTSQYLLCSSWNKNVSLYDVNADKIRFTYEHKFPVLDACFVVRKIIFIKIIKIKVKKLTFYLINSCKYSNIILVIIYLIMIYLIKI